MNALPQKISHKISTPPFESASNRAKNLCCYSLPMVGESALEGMTPITSGLHKLSTMFIKTSHDSMAHASSMVGTAGEMRV
jgi:hypothetical protein